MPPTAKDAGADANAAAVSAAPAAKGGFAAMLPVIVNLLVMPAIAYCMTVFVLVPKLQPGGGASSSAGADAKAGKGKEDPAKAKSVVPLGGRVLVNVAGTMGTRYLMSSIMLVGTGPEFKSIVDKNDAQLRDVAGTVLSGKSISDLEKPGARNLIRIELLSALNQVLGNGVINDIYITEFAIQ